MGELMREMLNLNDIDRKIVRGKERLGECRREIATQEKNIETARDKARAAEKAVKDRMFAADRLNVDLRAAEAEMTDQENKIKSIKNQKEYRIVTDRIKELKILIDRNETAILSGMDELDRLREAMTSCQNAVGEEELRLAGVREKAREETETIKKRHAELLAMRREAVRKVEAIDASAYQAYDTALKRTKGDPISEMSRDGICRACFRRQNSNVLNIVHIGKDVKNCRCQGCGRILYVKDQPPVEDAP